MWSSILTLVLLGVVGVIAGRWLIKKDEERETRRRAAAKLSIKFREMGLQRTPELLMAYAVGDYSGMLDQVQELAALMTAGDDAAIKEFEQVFNRVLEKKLLSEEGRAVIKARLEDAAAIAVKVAASAATGVPVL